MKQKISGFHQDAVGDWVADLACGHTQHVRHNPPLVNRAWVITPKGRDEHIGMELDCKKCDATPSSEVGEMIDDPIPEEKRRVAEAIKGACLKTALEAYQHAKMSGLCQEGAWELAMDAIRSLDVEAVLGQLPG